MSETLGLRLGSFQIGGGIVLFLFALSMIFGASKPRAEIAEAERDHMSGAVFPLAMPSVASPSAMPAIVILTENSANTWEEQMTTGALLVLVLGVTLARFVHRVIGKPARL